MPATGNGVQQDQSFKVSMTIIMNSLLSSVVQGKSRSHKSSLKDKDPKEAWLVLKQNLSVFYLPSVTGDEKLSALGVGGVLILPLLSHTAEDLLQ